MGVKGGFSQQLSAAWLHNPVPRACSFLLGSARDVAVQQGMGWAGRWGPARQGLAQGIGSKAPSSHPVGDAGAPLLAPCNSLGTRPGCKPWFLPSGDFLEAATARTNNPMF